MIVISTNTGIPQKFAYKETTLTSSFFRTPKPNGIDIKFDKVIGDEFFGKTIHGIKEAVVYAYSIKAQKELSKVFDRSIEIGQIGENLSVDDLNEKDFQVGSIYKVGTAELKVAGPRYPCNRFNICFKSDIAQKQFEQFNKPGVYFEVVKEGHVNVKDELVLLKKSNSSFNVFDQYQFLYWVRNQPEKLDLSTLKKILTDADCPEVFKKRFKARFEELNK